CLAAPLALAPPTMMRLVVPSGHFCTPTARALAVAVTVPKLVVTLPSVSKLVSSTPTWAAAGAADSAAATRRAGSDGGGGRRGATMGGPHSQPARTPRGSPARQNARRL